MIYAQISNGKVANTIVLQDSSLESLFSQGYDSLIRIDTLTPQPGCGWSYNGSTFTAPTVSAATFVATVAIPSAVEFATKLQQDFISWNILNGITQYGKTDAVVAVMSMKVTIDTAPVPVSLTDTLNPICPSLTTSVKVLQYHIDHISDYSTLSPFITATRLQAMRDLIKSYLGI